jgi:hypothetical protein
MQDNEDKVPVTNEVQTEHNRIQKKKISVEAILFHSSTPAQRPTQPLTQWVPGLFSRGKVAGTWR